MGADMINDLPVTLTFVALCAISLFALTAWIGVRRGPLNVLRGHGGDEALEKRIRVHGNFVENAAYVALVMLGAELLGLEAIWLWVAFASFWLGRGLHYLLYDRKSRAAAMVLTQMPALAMSIWILLRLWA